MRKLLTPARANAKTAKGGRDYEAAILHLAPAGTSGYGNVCPWASAGCKAACLNTSGRGQVTGDVTPENLSRYSIHRARAERTRLFMRERAAFIAQLNRELHALHRRAAKRGVRAVVRLNGTSDIPWETFGIPQAHPGITFYDYTKSKARAVAFAQGKLPSNYHLTFSLSEGWTADGVLVWLKAGVNVAAVFEHLPKLAWSHPVIDGLEHDFRFEDPRGVVVGLLPKGRAKRDTTGFVIRNGEK